MCKTCISSVSGKKLSATCSLPLNFERWELLRWNVTVWLSGEWKINLVVLKMFIWQDYSTWGCFSHSMQEWVCCESFPWKTASCCCSSFVLWMGRAVIAELWLILCSEGPKLLNPVQKPLAVVPSMNITPPPSQLQFHLLQYSVTNNSKSVSVAICLNFHSTCSYLWSNRGTS